VLAAGSSRPPQGRAASALVTHAGAVRIEGASGCQAQITKSSAPESAMHYKIEAPNRSVSLVIAKSLSTEKPQAPARFAELRASFSAAAWGQSGAAAVR